MSDGPCEIAWFAALCDDDYEFLGRADPMLASSWGHCRDIVMQAETGGFDNILLPSGYALGIDTTAFAAGIATLTKANQPADGGSDRRELATAACASDRDNRPDGGWATDDQHHLLRPAGRNDGPPRRATPVRSRRCIS